MRVRRGTLLQHRHERRLQEALRGHLEELVQRKDLVVGGKVQTQIATLDLPTLRYGEDTQFVAQGAGAAAGPSNGTAETYAQAPGGLAGGDHHDGGATVEIDFEAFVQLAQEMLLEELRLPRSTHEDAFGTVESDAVPELGNLDRLGLAGDLNLEETMMASLQRSVRERGVAAYDVDLQHDGWYFVEDPSVSRNARALEVYVLDISGSMRGEYLSLVRKMIFLLWYYLDQRYPTNVRRYVVFQDVAEEKGRDEFFAVESAGGTHISTGFAKAMELLSGSEEYDRYLFMFTDGETSGDDVDASKRGLDAALAAFDFVGYAHVSPGARAVGSFSEHVESVARDREKASYVSLTETASLRAALLRLLRCGAMAGEAS